MAPIFYNHDTEGTWYPPNRVKEAFWNMNGKMEENEEIVPYWSQAVCQNNTKDLS